MKTLKSLAPGAMIVFIAILMLPCGLSARPLHGETAPAFALNDINGHRYDLNKLDGTPVLILYFFDAASRTSQEGLLNLNEWVARYKKADLAVWAVTRSDRSGIDDLLARSELDIPILMDRSGVSELYDARTVLPTVCIIGPRKRVLHFIQGGGKSNEITLTRLAEVQLQRRQTRVAAEMAEEIRKRAPENLEARAIAGHAQLQAGQVDQAEETFKKIPADSTEGRRLRQEGVSAVYLARKDFDEAWKNAKKLEQLDPDSAAANIYKAEVLLNRGDKKAAEKELDKGLAKPSAFVFQKSDAVNKKGRLASDGGRTADAIELYARAEEIDPYNIEATSNKGLLLEEEGQLDQALAAYRQVLDINKKDIYASVFAKRVEARLAVENDLDKKKRMDTLIKELSTRFTSQSNQEQEAFADDWTSRPTALSFINLKESGGLPDRDGFVLVLADRLSEYLNSSSRVNVVERRMLEAVISELNLGSSQLADPQTALKLGKLFAARIIVTGTVHYLPGETLLSLRLLDTETSQVAKVLTRSLSNAGDLEKELGRLNREILETVTNRYPLQGYIVNVSKEQVMLNIGQNQGVVLGTRFAVLEQREPVTYRGRVLGGAARQVALLKVVQVEPDFSMARIVSGRDNVGQDDKVAETPAEL